MPPSPRGPHSLRRAGRALFRGLPGLAPAFLVIALLACVLVPLPTAIVDLLLSISLAGSVLLLVASLGVRRTTEFLNFPSLLLLVTLYRLALNISTTRLILSQADAGRVIDAFAGFVIAGDIVVGGVMFGIITVVQYVVIARGAERVAEVAARFALDGLPGHQAAIDADLRAGVISPSEAARRRARLGERSSFYGAMDGAIRFVKGDAVAGLAITGINLLGGIAIGMVQRDYDWSTSLSIYGRLTIGDGLLAQIPALLVSLAAGVLVSRVDRQDEDAPVGLMQWVQPTMLVVPATMLVVLALVPSMPSLAFLTTAVALVTLAVIQSARRLDEEPAIADSGQRRLSLGMSPKDVEDARVFERTLSELRMRCSEALGIEVPAIELELDRSQVRGRAELRLDDRVCATTKFEPGRSGEDTLVVATFRAVMELAEELIDLQDLDRAIEQTRATHPVVVRQALTVVQLPDVLAVVRGFLRERIPLPPLRSILSVMAEGRRFRDPAERSRFPEIVRERLASAWAPGMVAAFSRWARPRFVRLDPEAEEELLDRVVVGEDGLALTLSSNERQAWHDAIRAAAEPKVEPGDEPPATAETPPSRDVLASTHWDRRGPIVLVATPAARRSVAELARSMTPFVPVLSTAELEVAGAQFEAVWLSPP